MSISDDRDNPFAPPKATVLEAPSETGAYIAEGRKLSAGRGIAWFTDAWKIFIQSPGMWVLLFIVFLVLSLLFAIVPLGGLVSSIAYPAVAAGLMLGCQELEQGGALRLGHLFEGFKKNAGNLILVGALYLVGAMGVGFIVGLGTALAIPAFISGPLEPDSIRNLAKLAPIVILVFLFAAALLMPLFMAIWFAPALVVFHDLQPMAAMKTSFKVCLRNFVPFLLYGVAGLVLAIVAVLPFGLGLLVFGPLVWISMYTGYRDIFLE